MLNFEIYQGQDDLWYWRARSRNGQIVAVAGEGYTRKSDARRGVYRLIDAVGHGNYHVKYKPVAQAPAACSKSRGRNSLTRGTRSTTQPRAPVPEGPIM